MTRHGELGEALLTVSATYGTASVRYGVLGEARLATATSTRHGRLAEVTLTAATTPSLINPISDTRAAPFDTVTITGSLVTGQAADSWTFTQTGGPTVPLSGTGNVRTFTAPPTVDGTSILVQLDAVVDGTPADSIIARYLIYPQQKYRLVGTTWYAYKPLKIP